MKLRPAHRARRFFGSLFGSRSDPGDEQWAREWMEPQEAELFARMRPVDRRHSIAVARAVEAQFDAGDQGPPDRWVMAAALLHDVGKTVPDLGTYGRVVATLSGWVGGDDMAEHWADTTGLTRRVGLYLMYPRLGADLLAVNGVDERVVAWAREHHLPEQEWTVPVAEGRILASADDSA